MRTLREELALDLIGNRRIDDDRIFGRAQHPVVERLAGDDVVDGLLHHCRPLDERRRIAGADAVRRLARTVGSANQTHAAGRQNHGDVALLHQFLRPLERHGRHPVDRTGRRAGAPRRFFHHFGDSSDAPHRRRMRAEHDRASCFERDQNLVDRRRRGIGGRHDRGDDAERLRDFDDATVVVARNDADRLHWPDEVIHLLRAEEILLDLVFDDAVAGFIDGESRERFGLRRGGGSHRIDNCVDALLAELGQLEPRLLRAPGESACLSDGGQIAIGLRSG
jgi:hypothetical protein